MKLISASIPDGHEARARWLEAQLTGLNLRELVSELAAVHASPLQSVSLDDVLSGFQDEVLARGLVPLPRERIQTLLRQPALLFELQDLALIEGGAYWQSLPLEPEHAESMKSGWTALETTLGAKRPARVARPAFYRRPLFWCSAAAVILVAVIAGQQFRGPQWGLNNGAIYANDVSHADYVKRLCEATGEWFDDKPPDRAALAVRIGEFKHGCEKLLAAEHAALSPAERDELLKRCRNWIAQLDKLSADLNSGRDEGAVRLNTDAIVEKLQNFLKTLA